MERLLLRNLVFVLAFGFGISISAIWRIYTLPDFSIAPPPQPVIETVDYSNRAVMEWPKDADTSGEPQIIGETHSCGASTGPQVYNYTDGGRITVNCRRFKSSNAATREVQSRLSGSSYEDYSLDLGGDGTRAGEEVLITAPAVVRIRRTGRLLCEVEASSLKHLRLFEKRP
jgi:hypothetical protein